MSSKGFYLSRKAQFYVILINFYDNSPDLYEETISAKINLSFSRVLEFQGEAGATVEKE